MRGLSLLVVLLALPACDWAAADGPWNQPSDDGPQSTVARVEGRICEPGGLRDVPGIGVRLLDANEEEVAVVTTDPWGRWDAELPSGRFSIEAGVGGNFEAYDAVLVDEGSDGNAGVLCLERGTPQSLLFRAPVAESTDLLGQRLSGLGLAHVHEGPGNASEAAQILASPAGLVEYGIVALLGGLDFSELASAPGALDGLRDHLAGGGGLFLSADAWPVFDALAPGSISLLAEPASGGWVLASIPSEPWEMQLQWPDVGVPVPKDALLFELLDGESLLRADVPAGEDGAIVTADLLVRVPVDAGTVVLSSFLAPPPRADGWWMGDPVEEQSPNGVWDGRGAVLDRVLLQF